MSENESDSFKESGKQNYSYVYRKVKEKKEFFPPHGIIRNEYSV